MEGSQTALLTGPSLISARLTPLFARLAPLPFLGPSAIISPWAAKPVLLCLLLLRLPRRVERPTCHLRPYFQRFPGSSPPIMPNSAAAFWTPFRAMLGMKKGRRPRRRPHLKLFGRTGPARGLVPAENTPFPAEIAGFLMLSRAVPAYPRFLIYPVPVHYVKHF